MKRTKFVNVLFWLTIALVLAIVVPIGRIRIIGFDYRKIVDNSSIVCPDRVVGCVENVIQLNTGEKFRVNDIKSEQLALSIQAANGYVKIDRTNNFLAIRKPTGMCGNRPEMNQIITIPLNATETVDLFYAEDIGMVEPVK